MAERDRELLVQFLNELEDIFVLVFEGRRRFLPEHLIADLEEAWEPILSNFRMAQDAFESSGETLEGALGQRGLTGPQLRLKYNPFRRALDAFRARVFVGQAPRRLLGRLLGWADIILDSLGVVPGVDAIKEAKEVIEAGNDELRKR